MTPIPPEDSFQSGLNPSSREELDQLDEAFPVSNEQPDDLVTAATFVTAHEAELGRLHLEEAGLRGYIADAETVAMDWMLGNAIGYVKLQVARRDLTMAADILARHPAPSATDDDDDSDETDDTDVEATCLSCGAAMTATTSTCPSCGWSYEGDETSITDNPPTA